MAEEVRAIEIDSNFPGGNIVIDKIEATDGEPVVVTVRPDLRDTMTDWFYWSFRVQQAQGKTVEFRFDKPNRIGARGPAVSTDGGRSWKWLGKERTEGANFRYRFEPADQDVRFSFAFPYTEANLQAFLKRHAGSSHLKVSSLCRSEQDRDVFLLKVGRLDGKPRHRMVMTCRHHACESMASFAVEGVIEEVLGETPEGVWLRENVEFFIVPIIDRDGVENGDQGKNRRPYDHNRDYAGEARYNVIRALREQVPAWSDGKLRLGIDMHCPAASGPGQEEVFFVGGPNNDSWREIGRLSDCLEAVRKGPIPYQRENNIPFGASWNSGKNYGNLKPFSHWMAEQPGVSLGTTLEIAYANAEGTPVTDTTARLLGHDLAKAICAYLQSDKPAATN